MILVTDYIHSSEAETKCKDNKKYIASLKEKILLKKKERRREKETKTTVGGRRLTSGCNGL